MIVTYYQTQSFKHGHTEFTTPKKHSEIFRETNVGLCWGPSGSPTSMKLSFDREYWTCSISTLTAFFSAE